MVEKEGSLENFEKKIIFLSLTSNEIIKKLKLKINNLMILRVRLSFKK